jgi:hypothetical protein
VVDEVVELPGLVLGNLEVNKMVHHLLVDDPREDSQSQDRGKIHSLPGEIKVWLILMKIQFNI